MASSTGARVYLVLLALILIAVGGVSVATPPPTLTGVAQVVSVVLIIFGAIGLGMTAAFGTSVSGLTNTQQAYLLVISIVATSVGGMNTTVFAISASSLWILQLALSILGVIGLAIKEALGTIPPPPTAGPLSPSSGKS
jgi:hypothetical protein